MNLLAFPLILLQIKVCFGVMTGGIEKADKNSDSIQAVSDFAVKRIDAGLNSPYMSKLVKIVDAKTQVVAGIKYFLDLEIGYTTCRKGELRNEDCEFDTDKVTQICHIEIYERPWENYREVTKEPLCRPGTSKHIEEDVAKKLVKRENLRMLFGEFKTFMKRFNKSYESLEEQNYRFKVFCKNMELIEKLQQHEQGTAIYGATIFADLTELEFRKHYVNPAWNLANRPSIWAKIPVSPLPKSFDWRDHGAVTPVKNQGMCGSCWAFSVTGNIEGQWAINKGHLYELSEQELVDCDKLDDGCNGGMPTNAYKEIIRLGGLEDESDYPYEGHDEKCAFSKREVEVFINGSVSISKDEEEMAAWLVHNGPISIGINANAMMWYMGGVSHPWKILCSHENLDHGVLIVGFGNDGDKPYWIIKNSWGTSWGEDGYYRVYRGDGTCGLNLMCTSATIK